MDKDKHPPLSLECSLCAKHCVHGRDGGHHVSDPVSRDHPLVGTDRKLTKVSV